MAEFNDKNNNTNNTEPVTWQVGQPIQPDVENLSEDEIYRILQEDAADIEPPASLSPAAIEKKLQGVRQEARPRRSPWLVVAGMAACLVFGVMIGIFVYSMIRGNGSPAERQTVVADNQSSNAGSEGREMRSATPEPLDDNLTYDKVCEIINNYNSNHQVVYEDYVDAIPEDAVDEEASDGAASAGRSVGYAKADSAGSSQDYSKTDEQVTGVEEGDIVKTDGKHIFTIESSTFGFTIHVIEPNGSRSQEIGEVEVTGGNCAEMYLVGDKIFTIGTEWGESERAHTQIAVIDISDPANPEVIHTHTQSGRFNTSRICDGHLYVFTEDNYMREERYIDDIPEDFVPVLDKEAIPEERITRAGDEDTNNYMVMTSLNVQDPVSFVDKLAVLGGGATYYVSTDHIYIARPMSSENRYMDGGLFFGGLTSATSLTKFTYNDGVFSKNASTTFRGAISNSYYMHEYQGNFCFVYTGWSESTGESYNGLCVLDGEMKKLGELKNIAPGEQIYASYYMNNMAYFVTYRNTDPVFAVDIENPEKPEILSKLKLPGFSSYLHSFGERMLLGIGYGDASKDGNEWDNTAKLSLFEIGEDYDLKELSKTFGEQYARHIADQNHRAVFVDEARGIVGLGLNCYNYTEGDDDDRRLEHYVAYQKKGDKLVKVMDTAEDKSGRHIPVQQTRGVRIGETFYVCNSTGVVQAYEIGTAGASWKKAK